jgi:hypothetical protein
MTRHAVVGGVLWITVALGFALKMLELTTISLLFLLAPLVTVPLGLELASRIGPEHEFTFPIRLAQWLQPVAATFAAASFWFSPGPAAILVLPWFVFASFLGVWGFVRLARGGFKSLRTFCTMAGLIYLPVGCAWLVASRAALSPMGFQEPIVLLTAVHFHFAGFAAPILAAATAASLQKARAMTRTVFKVVAIGVVAGPGLLAAGFLTGPRLKLVAALMIVVSEVGLALFFLLAAYRQRPWLAQVLIVLSSASVLFAMVLVAVWAIGDFLRMPLVDLAAMARFHGTANAIGFTTCALVGWTLAARGGAPSKGGAS